MNIFFWEIVHFKTFIFKFKILECEKINQDYEKEIHKLKDELNKQDIRIEAIQNELDKIKLEKSNYSGRILFLFFITNTIKKKRKSLWILYQVCFEF